MGKTIEIVLRKELIDEIVAYCNRLKNHAHKNNIDLSNILIKKY